MLKKPGFYSEETLDSERHAWIYQLKGKFVGNQDCYDFLEKARDNINEKTPHVVLLMSGITLINSTGIGMIAALFTSAGGPKGKLFLVAPSEGAKRQLVVTHLWEYLKVVDDLGDLPAQLEG